MEKEKILEKVIEIIRAHGMIEPSNPITLETHFRDDLWFDDLDIAILLEEIEEFFKVKLPEDLKVITVADVVEAIINMG